MKQRLILPLRLITVVIKGKDIVTVKDSNGKNKIFNFLKMKDLTLEAGQHGIYLDGTLTGVHIGRQGIKGEDSSSTGEEDPLNNVTITAGSGHAIYVKTGDWANGIPDFNDGNYIDDPNGGVVLVFWLKIQNLSRLTAPRYILKVSGIKR